MVLTKKDKQAKAEKAFDAIAKGPNQIIGIKAFPPLMESLGLGSTYYDDEEKRSQAIEAMSRVWTYSYQYYCRESRALRTKEYRGPVIPRQAFLDWYWNELEGGDSDSDSDEESDDDSAAADRKHTVAQAKKAFNEIANRPNQILPQTIAESDFPELMSELNKGLPYDEEQHRRTLRTISEDVEVIPRQAFLDCFSPWYQTKVVEPAFDAVAKGSNHIATTDLPKLLVEKMGSNSYCKEVKVIKRQAFLEWYDEYMFGSLDD